jgi:hypothetical protein
MAQREQYFAVAQGMLGQAYAVGSQASTDLPHLRSCPF